MTRHWVLLLLSALLQVGWLVALRQTQGFTRLVPLAFYVLCGFTSALCLSKSLEGIPMSTAYAVWTGVSVAGAVLVDVAALRELGLLRIACIALILAGSAGLKLAGDGARPAASTAPAAAPKEAPAGERAGL